MRDSPAWPQALPGPLGSTTVYTMQTAIRTAWGAFWIIFSVSSPTLADGATTPTAGGIPTAGEPPTTQAEVLTGLAEISIDEKSLSESALRARTARRTADLVRAAADGSPEACVSAAEFILARQIEPALSREILDIATPEDRKWIAQRTPAAIELLNTATKKLGTGKDNADSEALRERIAQARAFAEVYSAIAAAEIPPTATAPSAAAADKLLQACRGLAGYIDAADPGLAASARLWQAAAYRRGGRADRALQLLPRVRTAARSIPYDYFSRLERCRALMDRGEYVAAAALSAQIGEEIDNWIPENQRDSARRANQALRAAALRRWSAALRTAGKSGVADDVSKDADSAETDLAHMTGKGMIRLELSYGGVNAPLTEGRAIARLLDIECADPAIAIVIDPSALKSDGWPEMQRAIGAFIRSLGENQSFAIVGMRGGSVTAYPDGRVATGGKADSASRAEQFLTRLVAGRADPAKGGDAMLHALELRPRQLFLVASRPFDDAFMQDLGKLLHDTPAKMNVIWLGSDDNAALQKLATDSGGVYRRPSAASKPADSEDDGGEDPAP